MSGTMEENHTAEVEMLHSVKVALKGAVLAVETMGRLRQGRRGGEIGRAHV